MLTLIFCLALAAILLIAIVLQRTYNAVPRKELKRHAGKGDELAKILYRAVAYGGSLRLILWLIIGLSSAELAVLISHALSSVLALVIIAAIIWLGYVWLPAGTAGPYSAQVAKWLTPPLLWLIERLHPYLDVFNRTVQRYRHITVHTGLYEKEDILELIEHQKTQEDNRISKEQLDIAANALTYGDKLVRDVMVPRRVIKTVKAGDPISPIVMGELHDSGFSRFPVVEGKGGKNDAIIGTLYLRDLIGINSGGKVRDVMGKNVYYANEAAPLSHVFQAFLKTQHHMFVVVNDFEETVGVITIEDILEQILGKQITDEFDAYDDLRAVAHSQAEKEKEQHKPEIIE